MSYYESAAGHTITRARALAELRAHAITDPTEFLAECGDHPTYRAQAVLAWLGY